MSKDCLKKALRPIGLAFSLWVVFPSIGWTEKDYGETVVDLIGKTKRVVHKKFIDQKKHLSHLIDRAMRNAEIRKPEHSRTRPTMPHGEKSKRRLWQKVGFRLLITKKNRVVRALKTELETLQQTEKLVQSRPVKVKSSHASSVIFPMKGKVVMKAGPWRQGEKRYISRRTSIMSGAERAIKAPHGGTIVFNEVVKGLGPVLVIESSSMVSLLYPLKTIPQSTGKTIIKGEHIGTSVEKTLHWELRRIQKTGVVPRLP